MEKQLKRLIELSMQFWHSFVRPFTQVLKIWLWWREDEEHSVLDRFIT